MLAALVGGNIANATKNIPPAGPGSPLIGSPIFVGSPEPLPPAGPGSPLIGSPNFVGSPIPPTVFEPTISGREAASGVVVDSDWLDDSSAPNSSTAFSGIWLIKTSTDCFIRVGADGTGSQGVERWYEDDGTSNLNPGSRTGTGTTVFQLNDVPDTVNIYNVSDTTGAGTPTFTDISGGTSYTSDDKSTFFSPTQDAKYGREIQCDTSLTGPGIDDERGSFEIQFTFRKSGLDDYTITFSGSAESTCDIE